MAHQFVAPLVRHQMEHGFDVAIACSGRAYADAHSFTDRMRSQGITVWSLPLSRSALDPLGDMRSLAQLVRLLRNERVELVHTHQSKGGIIGRVAASLAGVPAVHTAYDYASLDASSGLRRALYLWLERRTGRSASKLLFISESERQICLDHKIGRAEQLVTTGFGILQDDFDPSLVDAEERNRVRGSFGFSATNVVIGTVSRLVPRKGLDTFLRAAQITALGCPEARFLIVGGGPLQSDLRALAVTLKIDHLTTFTGFIEDQARIPGLYAAMDVFCSCTRREGYGAVCAEAGAMGKPCVGSDIAPVNEFVIDGVTGLLVPVDNAQGFADALLQLASDENLRSTLGDRARAEVRANCDLTATFPLIEDVYRLVLSDSITTEPSGEHRRRIGFLSRWL